LKSEVKRLYHAQSIVQKDDMTSLKRSNTNERKIMVLKEIVDKLKKERNDLTTAIHEFKAKSENYEKKYINLQIEYTQFNNIVQRKGFGMNAFVLTIGLTTRSPKLIYRLSNN